MLIMYSSYANHHENHIAHTARYSTINDVQHADRLDVQLDVRLAHRLFNVILILCQLFIYLWHVHMPASILVMFIN